MTMSEVQSDLDLPLLSNIDDIRVAHYNIDLTCDIDNQLFRGNILLVLASEDVSHCSSVESNKVVVVDELTENHSTVIKISNEERNDEVRQNLSDDKRSNCEYDSLTDVSTGQLEINISHHECSDETNGSCQVCSKSFDGNQVHDNIMETQLLQKNDYSYQLGETNFNNHQITTESISEETGRQNVDNVNIGSDPHSEHSFVKGAYNMSSNISLQTNSIPCDHTYTSPFKSNKTSENIPKEPSCNKDPRNDVSNVLQDFVMVLDAWDLTVTSVQEIILDKSFDISNKDDKKRLNDLIKMCDKNPLEFCSEKTCLKIWKPGIKTAALFPGCIRISYQTQHCGPSLKWTKDQDGRPCVYTHGHWINNRSLFPSQDVPGALSTWRAYIHVPYGMTVLMSGDSNPEILLSGTDMKTFIYYTDLEVPSSTLALAVGFWEEMEIIPDTEASVLNGQLPCRLFTPKCHREIVYTILHPYVPRCMESAATLLGPHPFKRLDILIVPASFASLGMASPSLMFLSQSVLSEDGHMLVRVAHELSHSWFGLAIGPRDWHEEWLSEGFSTYTEYLIHGLTTKLTEEELREERDIFDYLKYRTLQAEVLATDHDLQTLRKTNCDDSKAAYVSNGMNPDKGFLQLHYLKGYFLLRHLEDTVGLTNFKGFLKKFVVQFKHCLIDSMDVIQLYFKMFPNVRSELLSEDVIFSDWLNCPGLPKLSRYCRLTNNKLCNEVMALEKRALDCHAALNKLHWRKRKKLDIESKLQINKLRQVQTLLLLDKLIESEKLHHNILQHLNEKFNFSFSNSDVRHKWCELVIKQKFQECYKDIGHFLVHHQAMGVYLYGELIISRDKAQRNIAEKVFAAISDDMEEGVRKVVQTMIYGN